MTPQIIYLSLVVFNLLCSMVLHGKEIKKPDTHYNFYRSFFYHSIGISLLYWGGFFDVLTGGAR